jgi:hypothetical protein
LPLKTSKKLKLEESTGTRNMSVANKNEEKEFAKIKYRSSEEDFLEKEIRFFIFLKELDKIKQIK